ncbi:MAG: HAD family hydrolase [Gammaproteobacteria bacterium]|nr:HAD family hydrolase [Gammaproteobacteria bacterium]
MQRIRAVTLDLDDTLWDIAPVIRRAESELWEWLTQNYPRIPQRVSRETLLAMRAGIFEEHPDRSHDFRFLRKQVLAKVAVMSGYTTELVEPAFDVFDRARNQVEFFPDVIPVLEALTTRFRLIAVTNGNASLQKIGIRHLFYDVVTAVDAGAAKPARPIFDEAIRRSGVERGQILHVGDHPENDVQGARDAGMKSAWMNRSGGDWPANLCHPDAVVTTMTELQDLLIGSFAGKS